MAYVNSEPLMSVVSYKFSDYVRSGAHVRFNCRQPTGEMNVHDV